MGVEEGRDTIGAYGEIADVGYGLEVEDSLFSCKGEYECKEDGRNDKLQEDQELGIFFLGEGICNRRVGGKYNGTYQDIDVAWIKVKTALYREETYAYECSYRGDDATWVEFSTNDNDAGKRDEYDLCAREKADIGSRGIDLSYGLHVVAARVKYAEEHAHSEDALVELLEIFVGKGEHTDGCECKAHSTEIGRTSARLECPNDTYIAHTPDKRCSHKHNFALVFFLHISSSCVTCCAVRRIKLAAIACELSRASRHHNSGSYTNSFWNLVKSK